VVRSGSRWVCALLALAVATTPSGCAAMFEGQPDLVRVSTSPPGGVVLYEGVKVRDGETISVSKRFETPCFYLDADHPYARIDMTYQPSAWLIGDGLLLFVFIIPGVVAFAVDFGTGAWRRLHDVQIVVIPGSHAKSSPRAST
jgi:hypothetical protein